MMGKIEEMLKEFKPCFSHAATYTWFVIVIIGLIVRYDHHGVSSFVRCFSLDPASYKCLLHYFRTPSWDLKVVIRYWVKIVIKYAHPVKIKGFFVLIADNIKVAKAAQKMAAVKRMKQKSNNSNKPKFFFGHNHGVVSLLVGTATKFSAIPLMAAIQEGVQKLREFQGKQAPVVDGEEKITIQTMVVQEAIKIVKIMQKPSLLVLDAYFSVSAPFKMARDCVNKAGEQLLHLIIRAKKNYVGYKVTYNDAGELVKGARVKLKKVFKRKDEEFESKEIFVYGEKRTISYYTMDLIWNPLMDIIRFVWVIDGDDKIMLMSSTRELSAVEILQAYGYRFKIEFSFKCLKYLMGAFSYHFWTKALPKLKSKSSIDLNQIKDEKKQKLIADTATAIERFVSLSCIALGILQIIAQEFPQKIWQHYAGWLKTKSSTTPSVETTQNVVRNIIYPNLFSSKNISNSLIFERLRSKQRDEIYLYEEDAA
ncbi:MAG: hypothetical protein ACOC6D_07225 [Atribacterota bacterium]